MSGIPKTQPDEIAATGLPQGGHDGEQLLPSWQDKLLKHSLEGTARRHIDQALAFIRAANELLGESPDANLAVQDVADRAGKSLRTLYQLFRTKDDLLLALLEVRLADYADAISDAVGRYTDPLDKLALVASPVLAIEETRRREHNTVANLARFRKALESTHPSQLAKVERPVVDVTRAVLEQVSTSGVELSLDVEQATHFVMTVKSAYVHTRLLGNPLHVPPPPPETLVRIVLAALGATPPPEWAVPDQPPL